MRVALCTPFGGVQHPEHMRRKQYLQSACLEHTFVHAEIDLYIVSKARNSILSVIPPDVDVAWFVDSDILLPQNARVLLDATEDNEIVSGLYFARQPPHLPQAYNRAGPGLTNFSYLPVINIPDGPFHCDAVGAGCLLIRTEVLGLLVEAHEQWVGTVEKWMKRWLRRREYNNETRDIERALRLGMSLGPHFEFLEKVGEDFYFCEQLRYFLGIRPLVIPEVECEHVGYSSVTRASFEQKCIEGGVQFVAGPRKEAGKLAP